MAESSTARLGDYRLEIAADFGPRVIGLRRDDGPQVLARLGPEVAIDHPGGVYRFHGGHRLWAAPERAVVTYANDDHPCRVDIATDSVTISADWDEARVRKEMTVTLDGDGLMVAHSIAWQDDVEPPMAAWAITQLPLGGIALLPLQGADSGPLPNRRLVLWPYSSPADDRIRYMERGLEMKARGGNPLKLGTGPSRSRLGYLRDGWLFTKECVSSSQGEIPDLGAGSQVYVGQGFCELETLGGLTADSSAHLTERWTLRPCHDLEAAWAFLAEGGYR